MAIALIFILLIVFLVAAAFVQNATHVYVIVDGGKRTNVGTSFFIDPKDWVETGHLCTFFKEIDGNEVTYHITTERRGWTLGVKEKVNKPAFFIDRDCL